MPTPWITHVKISGFAQTLKGDCENRIVRNNYKYKIIFIYIYMYKIDLLESAAEAKSLESISLGSF